MSTVMMNGFGFSRFMVESFAHTGGVKQSSSADGSVSITTTTTPASSSHQDTESATTPTKSSLSPDTFSRRSTAETDPDDASRDEVEPPLPLSVKVAYDRAARVAFQASSRIDWHQLRSSTSLWDQKKKLSASSSFAIYTRQSRGMHYVMALGTLSCTLAELETILRPTAAAAYHTAMAELYSDAFVDGAIRYRSSASSSSSRPTGRQRAASSRHRSRSGRTAATTPSGTTSGRPSLYSEPLYGSTPSVATTSTAPSPALSSAAPDYVVKTATFARAHVFAKAQQWTFLECFQPTADGFMVTLSSLSPRRETTAAPVPTKRECTETLTGASASTSSSAVEHLQGITAAYSVAVVPSSSSTRRSELLVTFYSKFADDSTTFGPLKRHAFKLTLRTHLLTMARAATRLPMIIRRKRLDALALTSAKAFSMANNALCICCTATLHFLRAKTRCYACGYFVCDRCSLEQEVSDVSVDRTRVCQLCIRRVDHAVYNDRGELADALDALPSRPVMAMMAREAKTPSMADVLDQIFHTAPERKRTVLTTYVQGDCEPQATLKLPHTRLRSSSLSSLASSLLSPASSVDMEAFASPPDRGLRPQDHQSPLGHDDSVWVDYEDDGDFTGNNNSSTSGARTPYHQPTPRSPSPYPVPQNDAHRSKMAQQQLAQLEDVSSLEIICSIASQELSCPVAMVTLVASTKTHVVATNCAQYRRAVVPRSESLCAYTVMHDDADDREMALREPLVVAQPALDARFRDLAIVQQRGLQFYCGFPLTSEDGSVVGALCCGDFAGATSDGGGSAASDARPALTPQQTDAMVKLAATASRVMQLRGKDAYKRL